MAETFEGTCQCGSVTYRVSGVSCNLFVCHCSECQRQSSSAFGMALWVRDFKIEALSGTLNSWARDTPGGQKIVGRFCAVCGTRIFHEASSSPNVISIKPGTLNDTSRLDPVAHIWVDARQPWVRVPGNCIAHGGNPPGFEAMIETWQAKTRAEA